MARFTDENEATHAHGRLPLRVYVSRSWPYSQTGDEPEGLVGKAARFAYEVFDANDEALFTSEEGIEVRLRETPARQQVKVVFFEDDRSVPRLIFQRFGPEGTPYAEKMSLKGSEVVLLKDLLEVIQTIPLTDSGGERFSESAIRQILAEADARRLLYDEHRSTLTQLIQEDVDAEDIFAFAHRQEVLKEFRRLLEDTAFFDAQADAAGSEERVWQDFFEQNQWLLGMNLALQFLNPWDPEKLERTIRGHSVDHRGKRVDALLTTAGLMRSLCLVELKTHRTPLLKSETYRAEAWPASPELSGGIAQCHATAEAARDEFDAVLRRRDRDGAETGESALAVRPRSVLIIGSLAEFRTKSGVNHKRFQSFEMLRRTLVEPEIVTYDELFERARLSLRLLVQGD